MDVIHNNDKVCFKKVRNLIKKGEEANIIKVFNEKTCKDCVRLIEEVKFNPLLRGSKSIIFVTNKSTKNVKKLNHIKDILILYSRHQSVNIEFK